MATVDNEINWRKVYQDVAANLKVEATLAASSLVEVIQDTAADLKATVTQAAKDRTIQEPLSVDDNDGSLTVDGSVSAEVTQSTAADLKCTNTPDGTTEQPVKQTTAANLKCTNTPDGTTTQPVTPPSTVRGIWPAPNSTRVFASQSVINTGEIGFYTVPAGKILFISGISLSTRQSAAQQGKGYLIVRDDQDTPLYSPLYLAMETAGQIADSQTYVPAIEVPAGYDIAIVSNAANCDATAEVTGWLEDA